MKKWLGKLKPVLFLSTLAILLSGCGLENLTALKPKGYGADSSMNLIILTTVVMTFVFVAVMIVYIIVLLRFRKKKGEEEVIPVQVEGNKTLEAVWTIIPIILVIIMAVPTIIATFDLADSADADEHLNINVIGKQFWWHFDYEEDEFSTSQDMYIPTNTKVYVHLKSEDVIHSFWVPSLSGKLDVNPENVNTMFITADEEGVYYGKCAEFCGLSHALMDFKVIAVSPEEYDQWVEDMQNADPENQELDSVAQEGKDLFEANNCMTCHATGDSEDYTAGTAPTGPDLTNFGDRTRVAGTLLPTEENLVGWITKPDELKPGTLMPNLGVSDEDAEKIAKYLMQLQPSEVTPGSAGD